MLAELHELSQSLDRFGVAPIEVHPWVKPLSKGPFLIASLDPSGAIRTVEIKGEADAAGTPKIQKDNQNAFPTFKLEFPIVDVDANAELREKLKASGLNDRARASLIREAMPGARTASLRQNATRLGQLRTFSVEVRGLLSAVLSSCPALARLTGILCNGAPPPEEFFRAMTEALLIALESGENQKIAQRVLIGDVGTSGTVGEGAIPLVFDVYPETGDGFRVAHAQTGISYSRALLHRNQGEPDGVCCLTGQRATLERENLPSPRLPVLADTILFSAFDQIPCLKRYSMTGSGTFPIGRHTAQRLHNVALWLTAPDRKGKTWAMVPRSHGTGRDLLIAYINLRPDLDADVAELLSEADTIEREGVFEAKAGTLLKALDELKGKLATGAVLRSFVLSRISKGQVQVELTRQFGAERISWALREWMKAFQNAPALNLMVPAGEGNLTNLIGSKIPFPGEIAEVTKWIWIRAGEERQSAPGIPLTTVYDLFLGEEPSSGLAAKATIRHVLRQSTPLLLLTGDQLTRFGNGVRDLSVPGRYSALTLITLLGIALYKVERKKEIYMNETPFLLGRMLALSDVLHAQYCQVVRGGDLPPQLLGNQHYPMASEHPQRALAILADRLRVYQGWAQTAHADGALQAPVRIARWAVAQMGSVANELRGQLPGRFKDPDRAEMMLGYLAREKKAEDRNEQ